MDLTHRDAIYWIALGYLKGVGPIRLQQALEIFGDIKNFFMASSSECQQIGIHFKQNQLADTINWKKIEKDLHWCEQNHCCLLTWLDNDYPDLLKEIPSPPPLLYVKGDVKLLSTPQLAIVGSRNPTAIGHRTAEQFAAALVNVGITITSGLALGIDAASHRGALAAKGKTIAVMATGLKQLYPRAHKKLAEEIVQTGAIVSEFALALNANKSHFPQRNRIISGLSMGVLVVEAALKSGSLITARFAAEQGREVFAIPSSIHHPLGKGCHHLIRQGAKLVENIEDILVELAPLHDSMFKKMPPPNETTEKKVEDIDTALRQLLIQIGYEPTSLDTIVARSGLTPSEVSSMLLLLELKGYINTVPGGYILIK
jgi:DNA processing protein